MGLSCLSNFIFVRQSPGIYLRMAINHKHFTAPNDWIATVINGCHGLVAGTGKF